MMFWKFHGCWKKGCFKCGGCGMWDCECMEFVTEGYYAGIFEVIRRIKNLNMEQVIRNPFGDLIGNDEGWNNENCGIFQHDRCFVPQHVQIKQDVKMCLGACYRTDLSRYNALRIIINVVYWRFLHMVSEKNREALSRLKWSFSWQHFTAFKHGCISTLSYHLRGFSKINIHVDYMRQYA